MLLYTTVTYCNKVELLQEGTVDGVETVLSFDFVVIFEKRASDGEKTKKHVDNAVTNGRIVML